MTAYSRCSITFLFKVLQKVRSTPRYFYLVKWMGFGPLLDLDDCCVPRAFVQWVADNVLVDEEVIQIGSNSIQLSPQSVSDTLGTPSGKIPVDSDEENGKAAFLAIFGLHDVPSIRYFGKKILAREVLSDGIFCRCFMAVSLGTFLCPNSNTKISTKYMGALVVVDKIKERNWSKFIHEWTMMYIKKYLNESGNARHMNRTLGGCIYHLAVRCLDSIDFSPIQIPATLPRIRVWKGNLLKVCSDMYMGINGKYGAYPIRDMYDPGHSNQNDKLHDYVSSPTLLKQSIQSAIGDIVDSKLKELISAAFISSMKDEKLEFCMKAQDLILQVVQAFISKSKCSQDTLKISSSEEDSCKNGNESGSTEKLPASEEDVHEDDFDEDALVQRKMQRRQVICHSEFSSHCEGAQMDQKNADCCIVNAPVICEEGLVQSQNHYTEPAHSASLAHMVPITDQTNEANLCNDGYTSKVALLSKGIELPQAKPILIDLNETFIDEAKEGFSGFVDKQYHESVANTDQLEDRGDFLKIARQKYFFNGPSQPSFRLLEDEDDNGKLIEEPELYHPIGMDDNTYNQQIELAVFKCKNTQENLLASEVSMTPSDYNKGVADQTTGNSGGFESNRSIQCGTSIQCAQMQTSKTGLSSSPRWSLKPEDDFVDLVSPEVPISSPKITLQSTSLNQRKPDYKRVLIVGRRLFEENGNDSSESRSKGKSTVKDFLENSSTRGLYNSTGNELSPEVQILGEKRLKDNYTILKEQAEDLYNTSLSLGSSTYGKENFLPQRISQRSKYFCSPYDVNPCTAVEVQPIEKRIWEAVTTLCDIESENLSWAINIDNIRVSMLQLGNSMKEDGWVEAWLMNAFCRKLFRDNHPRKTNKHFFFNTISDYFLEKWKNEDARLSWKHKAVESFVLSNKARALHLSDGLYFPTVFNDHWFVFMVDIKYRNFIFLDSFHSKESSYHKKASKMLIKNFKSTWNEAGLKHMNFETFGIAYPNVPKQKTGNDCGIFTMKFLELFCARNPGQCAFSHVDITAFRIKYAHDILMSVHNHEEDAKFLAAGFNQ